MAKTKGKRKRKKEVEPAWMKAVRKLKARRMKLKMVYPARTIQKRIHGLRRSKRTWVLHPILEEELLLRAARAAESPNLVLAKLLANDWHYSEEDV